MSETRDTTDPRCKCPETLGVCDWCNAGQPFAHPVPDLAQQLEEAQETAEALGFELERLRARDAVNVLKVAGYDAAKARIAELEAEVERLKRAHEQILDAHHKAAARAIERLRAALLPVSEQSCYSFHHYKVRTHPDCTCSPCVAKRLLTAPADAPPSEENDDE